MAVEDHRSTPECRSLSKLVTKLVRFRANSYPVAEDDRKGWLTNRVIAQETFSIIRDDD